MGGLAPHPAMQRVVDEFTAAEHERLRLAAAAIKAREVHAFAVGIVGRGGTDVVHHRTAGRAKAAFWRDLHDVLPDLRFVDVTVRKLPAVVTSPAFARTATYRGMPGLQCGQRVEVRAREVIARGAIVGHNSSANFDVLFDDDSPAFAGLVLNVHPAELLLTETGACVAA